MTIHPAICQSILENPQELASGHCRNGWLYRIASIVSSVALFAIFTASAAIYFGLAPALPAWAMIIGLPFGYGCWQGQKLWQTGTTELHQRDFYQCVIDQLQKGAEAGGLKDWGPENILRFLMEQGISLDESFPPEIREALGNGGEKPWEMALLPLIARLKVLDEQAKKIKAAYERNLGIAEGLNEPDDLDLKFNHRAQAIDLLEEFASLQLRSAILLQNLHKPNVEYGMSVIDVPKGALPNKTYPVQVFFRTDGDEVLGVLHKKERLARMMELMSGRNQEFCTLSNKDKISLEQVKDFSTKELREELFEPLPPLVKV